MREVAIVGIGTVPWQARHQDTWVELGFKATSNAMEDCGLNREDIDAAVYSIFSEVMLRQQIADYLMHEYIGLQGRPSLRPVAGGATEAGALTTAYSYIAAGLADIVLCLGVQKGGDLYSAATRSRGDGFLKGISIAMDTTWLEPVCPGVPAYLTVTYLVPYMEKFGESESMLESIGQVSVKNHRHAAFNPEAQLHAELSLEEVLNSRLIAWPTTKYECCLYSDCATALVLASEKKARELAETPIWLSGLGTAFSHAPPSRGASEDLGRLPGAQIAAQKAYEMAGVKDPLNSLDIVELHDLISGIEILLYTELGLCQEGEGGRLVEEGIVERGGILPVNLSGGRVASGHVAGVSGLYSAAKVTDQLREQAGPMQAPIRNGKGLVHVMDGYGVLHGAFVLERES